MTITNFKKKRIIDFNPLTCGLKGNSIILFSPLDFLEGNNLYLPEKVRMADGTIYEDVTFDAFSFPKTLEKWEGDSLSMYVGKNYLQPIFYWNLGYITDSERDRYLHLPKVINIFLYDKEIDGCTSKNGILYCGENAVFVPDRNPYAESMPLAPVHGIYEDDYSNIDGIDLEGCGRDMFGGIYSLDGKTFIRWGGHDSVKSYRIRDGVKEIHEKAFRRGRGSGLTIKKIYLPDTLERIGKEAFMSCRLIPELTFPKSVVEIGERAFHNCQSLESVKFSSNLRIIGKEAFSSTGLKSILIPKNVVHLGDKCFDNCWQLSSIKVEESNLNYSSDDGVLYNLDKSVLLRIPPLLFPDSNQNTNSRKNTVLTVQKEILCDRDGIIEYENFFKDVTFITKKDTISMKEYKEIIRDDLFCSPIIRWKDDLGWALPEGCRVYVEDGEHVKSGTVIGMYIECEYPDERKPSRKEYTIQESVKILADGALQRSSLEKLIIPKNVEYIGTDQFQSSDITEIVVSPENEFYKSRDNAIIERKSKKLLHWFGKDKDIVIPQGVEIIGEEAAIDYYEFNSLVIPEGVKCIERAAFRCSLRSFTIYLPSTLCYVASNAFNNINDRYYDGVVFNIFVPHGFSQKYVKLLDYHGSKHNIKEIDSVTIENSTDADYKELSVYTEDDLIHAITDEYGIKYSKDGKRLLRFGTSYNNIVRVKEGTEVICDKASEGCSIGELYLPASVKYIGIDGVDAEKLIIEGKNAYFAGQYFNKYNTIFIPCGSWGRYYYQIETNMLRSYVVQSEIQEYDDYEEYKENQGEYQLIELSKINVAKYLQQQKDILISLISSTKVLSEHYLISITGNSQKNFLCYRTANTAHILYREGKHFLYNFADTLFILGYTLQDVCELLGTSIHKIEVNEDNKKALMGQTLARRVLKSWTEDFIDGNSGEVVSIERNEVILDSGHTIEEDDVKILLNRGIENVVVYDYYRQASYPDSFLIAAFPTSEEELSVFSQRVPELLFLGKEYDKLPVNEKRKMAYNLLTAYKAAGHSGYIEDVLVPLKVRIEEQHSVVTAEEKKLINLISKFFDQKINAIRDCKTDLDIMPLFTTNQEICNQLESFLKNQGISKRLINSFVKQLFQTLDL